MVTVDVSHLAYVYTFCGCDMVDELRQEVEASIIGAWGTGVGHVFISLKALSALVDYAANTSSPKHRGVLHSTRALCASLTQEES